MEKTSGRVKAQGSCLCGRVRYEIAGPFADFRYCHCERCRKATGSAHAANLLLAPERLSWISGESEITLVIHAEAENYPRAFCRHCGGPVPRLTRDRRYMLVPAGTLEDDPGLRPTISIFWRLRAPWFVPTTALPAFDERP